MVVVGLEQQPVDERVAALAAAVDGLHDDLSAEQAWQLPEASLLQVCTTLARLRPGVEAAYLAAVAEVDRRRAGAVPDGPRGSRSGIGSSTESFLRTSAPLSPGQARADVTAARALSPDGGLQRMATQLARGDITRAHVDVAVRCLGSIPEHLRRDQVDREAIAEFFAGLAPTRHSLELRRNGATLLERLAPDVGDRFDPRAHERRFFDTTTDSTGMLLGHFALDAVAGATLLSAVEACSAPLPTDQDGRDERTAPQRRADALVAIAGRAAAVSTPVRGERPRVVVHTSPEQLAGALAAGPLAVGPRAGWTEAGQDLDVGAVRRLSCDAVVQRVVWDRDGTLLESVPLDLGRQSRLADVHLRRALAARDRGCVVPGCGARPAHCDAHHVVHWADGGCTSLGNLVLLCGSHHTAVHARVWLVRMGADGIPEVVPPHRVDPLRRPRRAPHHDLGPLVEVFAARARSRTERLWAARDHRVTGGHRAARGLRAARGHRAARDRVVTGDPEVTRRDSTGAAGTTTGRRRSDAGARAPPEAATAPVGHQLLHPRRATSGPLHLVVVAGVDLGGPGHRAAGLQPCHGDPER